MAPSKWHPLNGPSTKATSCSPTRRRAYNDGTVERIIDSLIAFPHKQSTEDIQAFIDAFIDHETTDRLPGLKVPTLVLVGGNDLISRTQSLPSRGRQDSRFSSLKSLRVRPTSLSRRFRMLGTRASKPSGTASRTRKNDAVFMTAGSGGTGSGPPAARPACPPLRDGCVQSLSFLGIEVPAAGLGPLGVQPHAQLVFFASDLSLVAGPVMAGCRYSTSAVSTSCHRSSAATTRGHASGNRPAERRAQRWPEDDGGRYRRRPLSGFCSYWSDAGSVPAADTSGPSIRLPGVNSSPHSAHDTTGFRSAPQLCR